MLIFHSCQDITAGQPVYTLGKQIQWMYPDEFGDVFWMMGILHIEMDVLNHIGNWLDGSGLVYRCFQEGIYKYLRPSRKFFKRN